VGCGILGAHHARYFAAGNPRTRLVGLADTLAPRAQELAERYGARAYGDLGALLEAETLDLLVVATPDPHHRDPVLAAALAGVPNILTEKPMATSVADAEAMLAAAQRAGSRLWVHLFTRCAPEEIASRYVVQAGLIGQPVYGDLTLDDNISVPTFMWRERSRQWSGESSVAHFLMSHMVDRMRWLFGAEVERVQAMALQRVLGYTPDLYDARLFWSNGLVLRLKAEWVRHMEPLVTGRFTLSGESGGIVQHSAADYAVARGWQATLDQRIGAAELEQHQRALRERGVYTRAIMRHAPEDVEGPGPRPSLEISHAFPPLFGGAPPAELRGHIVNAILEQAELPASWQDNGPLPSGADGLEQTRIVCAIEEAARSGAEIVLINRRDAEPALS
jgi:predicted dehydrogenase